MNPLTYEIPLYRLAANSRRWLMLSCIATAACLLVLFEQVCGQWRSDSVVVNIGRMSWQMQVRSNGLQIQYMTFGDQISTAEPSIAVRSLLKNDFLMEPQFLGFAHSNTTTLIPFWFSYAVTAGPAGFCFYRYRRGSTGANKTEHSPESATRTGQAPVPPLSSREIRSRNLPDAGEVG